MCVDAWRNGSRRVSGGQRKEEEEKKGGELSSELRAIKRELPNK